MFQYGSKFEHSQCIVRQELVSASNAAIFVACFDEWSPARDCVGSAYSIRCTGYTQECKRWCWY
ncbi:uncharacterized protein M421DRAFT_418644 [Didymella exigua CBS 183.55]|uniref:Uncharacterized protein n=1 Tax=Didymella exigua CBS 183.55 TaxID=1150837 RepID=A0A6A5RRT0_9PLEO|nr:uncharacterized protein M421DRAFT_418644 [Didymella exigua CBS 183.55]KAF1930329.1 hypothetical protein M421DRAFT_418644 [Didymella exigua CBS 183.55]